MTAVKTRQRPKANDEGQARALWRPRNVALALAVVFVACLLVAWFIRDDGGSTPDEPVAAPTTTAPIDTSGDDHFLPRELEHYEYHAPQTSEATSEETAALTGAENVVIRLLVPETQDSGRPIVTMIVARYAPDDPAHQENLDALLEPQGDVEPRIPPIIEEVNGVDVSVIPSRDGAQDAVLWRRDANVDLFLQGAPREQLIDIMEELIR